MFTLVSVEKNFSLESVNILTLVWEWNSIDDERIIFSQYLFPIFRLHTYDRYDE